MYLCINIAFKIVSSQYAVEWKKEVLRKWWQMRLALVDFVIIALCTLGREMKVFVYIQIDVCSGTYNRLTDSPKYKANSKEIM